MQDFITFLSRHPLLALTILLATVLLTIVELLRAKRNRFGLSPAQMTRLINQENAVTIDIRAKEFFRKGHIIGAQSFLAKEIQENSKKMEKFKDRPIIMVCGTGSESQKIAAFLLKQDYTIYILAGGMQAWSAAGMPVIKE